MPPNNWKQWIKLTRKQLKQLRRSLDDELQSLVERNFPRPHGSLVRVPVPVRPQRPQNPFPVGNGFRSYHTASGRSTKFSTNVGARISTFSSSSTILNGNFASIRCPRGVPRGLFTNWNMTSSRFSGGKRLYSTASIKFTHDAVNNMCVSLRCFFSQFDELIPQTKDEKVHRMCATSCALPKRLDPQGISLAHTMEVYQMIQQHKKELAGEYDQREVCFDRVGTVVEFKFPELDVAALPAMAFASEETLNGWQKEMIVFNNKLKLLEQCVRSIHDHYGSLPICFDTRSVQIRFPNLTISETETLLRDLGITLGIVYLEEDKDLDDVLSTVSLESSRDDVTSMVGSDFFPISLQQFDTSYSVISSDV